MNDYLKGKEARLNRIAALAAACKVSLDWLATGAAPPNTGADIPLLQPEILDAKAHFTALLVVLSVCQEYHQKMHLTPSLREVLIWISNPYVSHRALPDRPVEFKPPQ